MLAENGLAVLVEMKQALPTARCVLLASRDESEQAVQAIKLGVAGYLLKDADLDELLRGIRAAFQGEIAHHPVATQQLISAYRALPGSEQGVADLTPAELRVLTLLTRGLSNRGLASELGVSEGTINTHIRHILEKLALKTRLQAALYARKHLLAA
jgi:DNA-binding NarL/FixJ family response regulator